MGKKRRNTGARKRLPQPEKVSELSRADLSGLSNREKRVGEGVLVAIVVFLALIPFFQTIDFGFVNYDDPLHVSEQPGVLEGLNSNSVGWAAEATPGNLWHPLTWMSFMAEVQWFGGGAESPGVHHGGNVFLYALTIMLCYFLVRSIGLPIIAGVIAVLLFALHPLHAEPVAWISARKDVLAGFFVIGCLLAYVLGRKGHGRPRLIWKGLSYVLFAAALLSKPSAVVVPALLILLDWFPLRRVSPDESQSVSWKSVFLSQLRSKWIYFVMALAASIVAVSVQSGGSHQDFAEKSSTVARLADAPGQIAFYFQRLLWPSDLIFEYSRPDGVAAILYGVLGGVLALGLSYFGWKHRERSPEILFGWIWVLVCLSPVLGLFYVGSSFTTDRYFYLALLGPVLSLSFFLCRETRWRKVIVTSSLAALVVFGVLSHRQIKVWQSDFSLFSHAVEVDPEHLTALGNLGSYYRVQKDDKMALKYYEAALAINPNDHIVHYNVAHIRNNQGDPVGCIASFRDCLRAYPNYERAHHFLGIMLADPKHRETYSPEEGLVHLKKAWDLNPQEPRFALNYIYTLHREGLGERAAAETELALEVLPSSAEKVIARLKGWRDRPRKSSQSISPRKDKRTNNISEKNGAKGSKI